MTDVEKVDQFVRSVKALADLLSELPVVTLAEAWNDKTVQYSMALYEKRRSDWKVLFEGISEQMHGQVEQLLQSQQHARVCLGLCERMIGLTKSAEYKESIQSLDKFVRLLKELKELKESGFVADLLTAIRHEVYSP